MRYKWSELAYFTKNLLLILRLYFFQEVNCIIDIPTTTKGWMIKATLIFYFQGKFLRLANHFRHLEKLCIQLEQLFQPLKF